MAAREGASCVSWIDPVDLDPGSSGRIKGAVGRQSCTNTNIGLDGGPQVTPGVEGSLLMKVSSALIKSSEFALSCGSGSQHLG